MLVQLVMFSISLGSAINISDSECVVEEKQKTEINLLHEVFIGDQHGEGPLDVIDVPDSTPFINNDDNQPLDLIGPTDIPGK